MAFFALIKSLTKTLNKARGKINVVFTGNHTIEPGDTTAHGVSERIADIGIFGLLDVLAAIDLCNIITYELNKLANNAGDKFDPNKPPKSPTASKLEIQKWNVQYAAYKIQKKIDNFNSTNGETKDKTRLGKLVNDLVSELKNLSDPNDPNSIEDPDLLGAFPEMSLINNFIQNSIGFISQTPDLRNVSNDNVQAIINFVDKVRNVCVKIQAISNPASAALSFLSPQLQENLSKLNKVIDPSKLIPAIRSVIQSAQAVRQVTSLILSIAKLCQLFVKIGVVLVKIFKVILKFLVALPAPALYATLGITTSVSALHAKIEDYSKAVIEDLKTLSSLLSSIISVCRTISLDVGTVIEKLTVILLNLEACNNVPEDLVKDLKNTISDLQANKTELDAFIQNYSDKKNKAAGAYYGYTIVIEKEQTLPENTHLVRRYGVALDANGIAVAQSTPTYASNDNIIIEEVQLILRSKGLIKVPQSSLTPQDLSVIQEALSYVQEDTVNQDLNINIDQGLDSPDNLNENTGLGLNAFINNIKGGKKLRQRVRASMSAAKSQLEQNLAQVKNG